MYYYKTRNILLLFILFVQITYQDCNIVILNKYKSIISNKFIFLYSSIVLYVLSKEFNIYIIKKYKYGILHRLDKITIGLLLNTKNNVILKYIQHIFLQKIIKKFYILINIGNIPFNIFFFISFNLKKKKIYY